MHAVALAFLIVQSPFVFVQMQLVIPLTVIVQHGSPPLPESFEQATTRAKSTARAMKAERMKSTLPWDDVE